MKKQQEFKTDLNEEILKLENEYFKNIKGHVQQEYENFSKENKMGQRMLLEYFGLQDLEKQKLGKFITKTIKKKVKIKK